MQAHTVGMYLIRETLVNALKEVLGSQLKAVYNKSAKSLPFKAKINPVDFVIDGIFHEMILFWY